MPTGYTANIKDGISFEEFVLTCARQFGACITLRDEPLSSDIPEFEPEIKFHEDNIEKDTKSLNDLNKMTNAQLDKNEHEEYEKKLAEIKKRNEENNDLMFKYKEMLKKVDAWTPPTKDHRNLKSFMIEQLQSSMDFDCLTDIYDEQERELTELTGEEWKRKTTSELISSMDYHQKHMNEEIKRTKERNEWVKALKNSLKCNP